MVEDDPTLLALYRYSFSAFHLPIALRLAPNGYEGLIRIGQEQPDILFTDLMMPGIDGFQMLRTLAHRPELADMQLVVVSGLDASEIADRGGLPANVTVLSKPIPFDRLEAMVSARCAALGIGERTVSSSIKDLMAAICEGVVLMSPTGKVRYANPAACACPGWNPAPTFRGTRSGSGSDALYRRATSACRCA